MEEDQDLSILNPSGLRVFRDRNNQRAVTTLKDYSHPEVTTSPDAKCISWTPRRSIMSYRVHEFPEVCVRSETSETQTFQFAGIAGEFSAVSSFHPRLVAFCLVTQTTGEVIQVMNSETKEIVTEIGNLKNRLGKTQVERLRLCSNGHRLVVGSQECFLVIETLSGQVIGKRMGRFPTITPDGKLIAYVDSSQFLRVLDVGSLADVPLPGTLSSIYGVAAWSPNSDFLLAGARIGFSIFLQLIAINTANWKYTNLQRLPEGDYGSNFSWISNNLVQQLERE